MSKLEQFIGNASCIVIVLLIAWSIVYTVFNLAMGNKRNLSALGGARGDTYTYAP